MIFTRIEPERRLALQTVAAELTMEGILNAMRTLYGDPEFQPDFGVVWDLRENDLAITLREILYLDPKIVQLANESRPGGKTAWVPATGFGAAIIKTLYREHSWAQEWRTFTSLDDAIEWASMPPR